MFKSILLSIEGKHRSSNCFIGVKSHQPAGNSARDGCNRRDGRQSIASAGSSQYHWNKEHIGGHQENGTLDKGYRGEPGFR